ncbi:MAG: ATP-binding protein, partial [Chloroflexi bacterium]|nr:ATP-binding protein [Chloroflexota bacterium]
MQQIEQRFIGRARELKIFTDWLNEPTSPWILYFHDAIEKQEKKGGIGKTWLLRRCQQLAHQLDRDLGIVFIDFFNLADRDRFTIAERVVAALQTAYPQWYPTTFKEALSVYRAENDGSSQISEQDVTSVSVRDSLSEALATDLQRLSAQLSEGKKALLIFFDTFELVEQNPLIAALGLRHSFPDTYGFKHIRAVIAGRNRINWEHPNWQDRQQEVREVAIVPFSQDEMTQYLDAESLYGIPTQSEEITRLYHLTEGRPILIGLTIDVLNHRTISLPELTSVSQEEFEQYLVPQISRLENPLNWVIMFMAHVYHRFNMTILDWILQAPALKEIVYHVKHQELVAVLPALSFVRRSGSGDDFVLHDEMRRLVTKYCWGTHDPDRRYRQVISRAMIEYYEEQLEHAVSEQERQAYSIEMLHHRLFVDIREGLRYFKSLFDGALNLWNSSFARLLLQETQQFIGQMHRHQQFNLLLEEARLLAAEENPGAALEVLQEVERQADADWREEKRYSLFSQMGQCYLQQSKLHEARHYFTECLAIAKARGEEEEESYAALLGQLGYIARRRGEFDQAIEFYKRAIEFYKKAGPPPEYADILNSMGNVYRYLGKTDEALRRCQIALRIRRELFQAEKIGERPVGLSLGTLGIIYMNAEEIVQAEQYFREAIDIYYRIGYRSGIAATQNRLGQIEIAKGNLDEAQVLFKKAEIAARDFDEESYINSLNKQGRILARQDKRAESAELYRQGIEHAKKAHDHYQQAEGLIDLCEALEHLGKHEASQRAWQEAKEIATRENYSFLLARGEEIQGDLYYNAGDYAKAYEYYGEFCYQKALYNELEYSKAQRKLTDLLVVLPAKQIAPIVDSLVAYWSARGLDKDH